MHSWRPFAWLIMLAGAGALSAQEKPLPLKPLAEAEAKRAQELDEQIARSAKAGRYAAALETARELLSLRTAQQGTNHWETISARWQASWLEKAASWPDDKQAVWTKLQALFTEGEALAKERKYADAQVRFAEVLVKHREFLGEDDPQTASILIYAAFNLKRQGKHRDAEPLERQALSSFLRHGGDGHPSTATACNNLGSNLSAQGKLTEAEPLFRQAAAIRERVYGAEHPQTLQALNSLGFGLWTQGRYADAEPLFRKLLELRCRLQGPDSLPAAQSCNNLAACLTDQGRPAEAEPLLRRAVTIRQKLLGAEHEDTTSALMNLAHALNDQKTYEEAQAAFELVVERTAKQFGNDHAETVLAKSNLGYHWWKRGRHAQAEPLFRDALAWRRQHLGPLHPETLTSIHNLASALNQQGKLAEAEPLFREALAQRQKALGEANIDTVVSWTSLAFNRRAQGDLAEATKLLRRAAEQFETSRLLVSDQGLLRSVHFQRVPLADLAACLAQAQQPREAWTWLETNLSRGLLDDLTARQGLNLTPAELRRQQELAQELRQLDGAILSRLTAPKPSEEAQQAVAKFTERRQRILAELSSLIAGVLGRERFDLTRIQKQIPPDAALVAWLDLGEQEGVPANRAAHWACIVKTTGEPIWIPLAGQGADGAWSSADEALHVRVREYLVSRAGPTAEQAQALAALRRQRLEPLAPHLENIRQLVILPSPRLAGIPLDALTDAYTISHAPSGTLFARLAEQRQQRPPEAPRRLLALGDPAFAPAAAPDAAPSQAWAPLPGSRREVEAIAALFPSATKLLGADASLVRLDELRQDKGLEQYQVLHLATHGEVDRRIAMNSALILAAASSADLLSSADRSRLTAEHLRSDWRLNADLVVLSACETGLGQAAGGEGYLGFSQPLFLAGARSVILSQWQVSDTATSLLMVRFYENWLGRAGSRERPEKSMSKAEALREAKAWLRNLTRDEVEKRVASLPEGARGLKLEPAAKPQAAGEKPFAHPYYWSAFILIGDPG